MANRLGRTHLELALTQNCHANQHSHLVVYVVFHYYELSTHASATFGATSTCAPVHKRDAD